MPVLILRPDGRPVWSPVFEGVPYILRQAKGRECTRMVNAGGARAYIASKTPERWVWRAYKPIPAEIFFTPEELAFAEPYRGMVMVEPNVKAVGHQNKAWSEISWMQFHSRVQRELKQRTVQCLPGAGAYLLPGATPVITPGFRLAAAVLSVAKAFVGTEGGLMHAAAAVSTPSVILWSEFISPEITGYTLPTMRNIRHAGKPCGSRTDCEGCNRSMTAILPDEVIANLKEFL